MGISYVYIEITEKCNGNCIYSQIDNSQNADMSFDDFKNIIDQLSELNIFEIRIGGGEPLLCSYITSCVEYAAKKNIAAWICTNGKFLTKNGDGVKRSRISWC